MMIVEEMEDMTDSLILKCGYIRDEVGFYDLKCRALMS